MKTVEKKISRIEADLQSGPPSSPAVDLRGRDLLLLRAGGTRAAPLVPAAVASDLTRRHATAFGLPAPV